MAIFFDTHAHLDYPDYAPDLPEVVARAQAAGITKIISIGTSLDSSERAVRLADKFPGIYAAVGWHPTEALSAPDDLRPALRKMAKHPKVVAIGETGLDYHHLPSENCSVGSASRQLAHSANATQISHPPSTDDRPEIQPRSSAGHLHAVIP